MRVLLATHGFPPEQTGGVELHTRELAFALAQRGHEVLVVSGTLERSARADAVEVRRESVATPDGRRVGLVKLARHDLYFDHWHKSLCADVARAFRDLVREFRPDVVHVQHWIRLTRDLVTVAAREGVPSVVTLHDSWASCPLVFRVKPGTLAACDATVGPHPCVACAARVPPRTPWIPVESGYLLLAERQLGIARELQQARVVIAPSAAHARAIERWLGRAESSLRAVVLAPSAELPAPRSDPAVRDPAALRPSLHLVTWGQVVRHKGVDLVLAAFLDAQRELAQEVRLALDVHGAEPDPAFAAELRAASREVAVSWRGPFEHGRLGRAVDPSAQVFVSGSRAHESFGIAASEAARLGLALLLPDAPAFVERFRGVALFYSSGDARALAEALVRLARRPERVDAAREAALSCAARFSTVGEQAERHLELYARAIAAGAPAAPAEDWFEGRMNREALAEWDRALSQRSREELGL